jgi:methylenetetrahydrofolate dehydrogenase (NADP+)/methenyltetrahydrofolate cyclohydrolase
LTKKFDILVSCVGKERVITADMITLRSILIGVGIWRDNEGKLRGDYNEEEIQDIAAYYTPTPGGVGPVNVATLMQNLVQACTMNGRR